MNYLAKSFLLLTMLLGTVSCNKGNLNLEEPDKTDDKVPVSVSSANVCELTSKAGVPAGQLTSGSLGLFFKTEDDDSEAYNATNREVSYSYGAWSIKGNTLYWKNEDTKVSYYAYYPYSSSVSANESLSFDVPATQNADNIKSADLLYSPVATTTKKTNEAISLSFKHALSKLKIDITVSNKLGNNYTINSVSLSNCKLSGEIALSTGIVSATGETTSTISLFKESDSSYECLLVPQSTAYSLKISLTIEGGEELVFEHTASSAHSFVSGYQYNLPVQLSIESKMTKAIVSEAIVSEWTTTNLDPIKGKIECEDNSDNEDSDDNISSEHEYVDLGLPSGTLWATCNVGADSPSDYGDYFAWGETSPKETYSWETYKYGSSNTQLTKYCTNPDAGKDGYTDNLETLESEDDAATANWGNGWRMPTKEEVKELGENCTLQSTSINGVSGLKISNKNDETKYIFLPKGGEYSNSQKSDEDKIYYWTSSLRPGLFPGDAYMLARNNFTGLLSQRYKGMLVRPVRASSQEQTNIIQVPENGFVVSCMAGTQEVDIITNTPYTVVIPEDAKSWLSVSMAETKAMQYEYETITFHFTVNEKDEPRDATVSLIDDKGVQHCYIQITQKGLYCISYTTTDGKPLGFNGDSNNLIDNKYENGEGRLIFSDYDYITYIEDGAFDGCSTLSSITIPDSVKSIGKWAFGYCIYNHRTTKTNQKYPSVNL